MRRIWYTLALALALLPLRLLAIVPIDGAFLSAAIAPIDVAAGNQSFPQVDDEFAVYSGSDGRVHFYSFATGTGGVVPPGTDAYDGRADVSGGRVAFIRRLGVAPFSWTLQVYDIVSGVSTELATGDADSSPDFLGIGGNTVAFAQYIPGGHLEVFVADIVTGVTTRLTDDPADDGFNGVGVSPAGDVVVWQRCVTDAASCEIYKAVRSGAAWVAGAVTNNSYEDFTPHTDGAVITYGSARADGKPRIYWTPVAGGAEQQLDVPGDAGGLSQPHAVGGGLVTFASTPAGGSGHELFAYHIATNRLFRVTSTADGEMFNDVAVRADGSFRIVWDTFGNVLTGGSSDVFGATVALTPVNPFTFSGFQQPVDPYPAFNVMKGGAAVPVRFSLAGFRGFEIFAPGYPKSSPIACGAATLETGIEQTVSAGNSSLRYDATTDLYSYIWKTESAWGGTCRQLVIQFSDGSAPQYANFKFK